MKSSNILNNIQTDNTWLDVETVAKLKKITKRGVRLALNQDKYEYKIENIKGGKTYKIKLIFSGFGCFHNALIGLDELLQVVSCQGFGRKFSSCFQH